MKKEYGKLMRADPSFIELVKNMSVSMQFHGKHNRRPGSVIVTKEIADLLKKRSKVRIEL